MNPKRHSAHNLKVKKLILYEPYSLYFVDFISKGIKVLNFRFLNIMNSSCLYLNHLWNRRRLDIKLKHIKLDDFRVLLEVIHFSTILLEIGLVDFAGFFEFFYFVMILE